MEMNLVMREALKSASNEEIQSMLESSVVVISEEIGASQSTDELKAVETALMEHFKANDAYLAEVTYKLEDEVEYDEAKYKRGDIINKVINFINRIEVEFRATLGIYQTIRYWKTHSTEDVSYAAFDSTLRMLGTMKYKGENDCRDILVVNNWFAGAHDQYVRDNVYTNYLATIHQAIMTQMEKLEAEAAQAGPVPVDRACDPA